MNTTGSRLQDLTVLAGLGGAAVGVPLWLSAVAGTIGIPAGDDWVYMRGAASLYASGSIDMPGHNAAAIGQLLLVQPLLWLSRGEPWAFAAFGLAMELVGVAASYLLARRYLGIGSAALVSLLVLGFPGFAREAPTFATDVPAFSLGVLSLLVGVRWLEQGGSRWGLVLTVATGLLAFSIREFTVAAPAAILATAWLRNRADERRALAGASAGLVVGAVGIFLVADAIPGRSTATSAVLSMPILLGPAFLMLAAVLLPASVLAIGRRMGDLDSAHILAAAGLIAAIMVVAPIGPFLWGYLATAAGSPDAVLNGARPPAIPGRAWALTQQLALLAGVLAATLVLRWIGRRSAGIHSLHDTRAAGLRIARGPGGALLAFLLLYAGELAAYGSANELYDRYLYPMVPAAAVLLLRWRGARARLPRSLAFSNAALAWLLVLALAVAANSFSYDAARHRAGEAAVDLGYDPQTVDAGYEWVGVHGTGPEAAGAHDYGLTWYDDLWPSFRPCAVVSNSPLERPGLVLVRVNAAAYRQYLLVGPSEPLYLYGSTDAGCPAPPVPPS